MTLAAATADPVGFVGDLPERVILDEVQRAPGIFTALKSAVDRHRVPGRFLLTGSAIVLLGITLAERIEAGGYPPALTRSTPRRRQAWYRDYVESLVQRDVRNLARISSLDAQRIAGVVLYDGETSVPFGEGLYAVPIRTRWETI